MSIDYSSSNWRSNSKSRAHTSCKVLMNVYRENIMYNFRNQTYCDLCAAIAFCKGNSYMLATMIKMRVLLEIIYVNCTLTFILFF